MSADLGQFQLFCVLDRLLLDRFDLCATVAPK
jgi:hypothetical protein